MFHLGEVLPSPKSHGSTAAASRFAISARGSLQFYVSLLESILLVIVSVIAGITYNIFVLKNVPEIDVFLGVGIVGAIFYITIGSISGLYRLPILLNPGTFISRTIGSLALSSLLVFLTLFLLKSGSSYSRGSALFDFPLAILVIASERWILGRYLRNTLDRGALIGRPTVIAGTATELQAVNGHTLLVSFGITEIYRVILPDDISASEPAELDALIDMSRYLSAERIALALSWKDLEQL